MAILIEFIGPSMHDRESNWLSYVCEKKGDEIMADWVEIAIRTALAVIMLFLLTKLLGKRQVSQLSLFEYITGITIGSLAAYISLDLEANWYLGLVALLVWVFMSFAIEILQLKSKTFRDWVDGSGTVLIKGGKILEDNLKKERLTSDELLQQLRKKNIFRTADVEFAMIEPSGEINVMLTRENQPITPKHLGIKVGPEKEPQAVIMDGAIIDEGLAALGYSRSWLHTELDKIGVTIENVYLGQVDSYGQLYVDLYDDQIQVPKPQQKALLLANLKKCEADLEMYALMTENKQSKATYEQCSHEMLKVIKEIKPFLLS